MADVVSLLAAAVTPVGVAIASSIATYAIIKVKIRNHPLILKEIMTGEKFESISGLSSRINAILCPGMIKENMSIMMDCRYASGVSDQNEVIIHTEMSFIIRNISRSVQTYKLYLDDKNIDVKSIRITTNGKRHGGNNQSNNINDNDSRHEKTEKFFSFSIDPTDSINIRVNFESSNKFNIFHFFRQNTMVAPGSRISIRSPKSKPINVMTPVNVIDISQQEMPGEILVKNYDIAEPLMVGDLIILHSP